MLLAATRRVRSRTPFRSDVAVLPAMNFGDHIRVLHDFGHAVRHHDDIVAGMCGIITEVDAEGDVLVQFAGLSLRKWVVGDERALLQVIYASNVSCHKKSASLPKPKVRATPYAYEAPAPTQAHFTHRPKWNVLDNRPVQNGRCATPAATDPESVLNPVATPVRSVVSGSRGPILSAVQLTDPDALSKAVKNVSAQIAVIPGTANTSLSLTFLPNNMSTIDSFHTKFKNMGIHIDQMTRAGVPTAPKQVRWAALAGDNFQPCLLVTFGIAPKEQKVSFQCRLKRSIVTAKGRRAAISANLELMLAFVGNPSSVVASNPAVARDVSSAPLSIVDMLRRSQEDGWREAP